MLEIERQSLLTPRYVVRDDRGSTGSWERRRFRESLTGELNDQRYELRREGRRRFALTHAGQTVAHAEAGGRGRWTVSVRGAAYELAPRSRWRSAMELRADGRAIGTIEKSTPRGRIVCDLPSDLSAAEQAFVGFVVLTLWNRAAASAGAAGSAATVGHG